MQIEIDRKTEKLLEELGATDPASRGAVIREALLRTLEAREDESLGLSEAEREAIGHKLVEDAEGSEAHELTDDDWSDIIAGRYRHPPDPNSLAVPPGWKPKDKQAD